MSKTPYNKRFKMDGELPEIKTPFIEDPVAEVEAEEIVTPDPINYGVVSNCEMLNIRNAPSINSKVATIVNKDTQLTLHEECKSGEWTKVTTPDGVEGYCMSKYISKV